MPIFAQKVHQFGAVRAIFCLIGVSNGLFQTVKNQNKAKFGSFASAVALPAAFPNLSRPRAKR
ncbi:hypothetical protein H3V53_27945 [Paraburkholderia bengalensis]|uniref:Uncharacterized protein n=1 Tax=Paraburkholderia bengalensis TaxID=2747562 RepID=A0ABU8IZ02_9BURK